MNRPIKFRAWDKQNEVMRSWYELLHPESKYFGLQWLLTNLPQDHKHEFMQFTGLLDKNGKEIYEGDILRVGEMENLDEDTDATTHLVEWFGDTGYPAFDLKGWGGDCNALSEISEADVWYCEVIGNIHENPKLLSL